jgi:addiction module toxin, RelE/StbE family
MAWKIELSSLAQQNLAQLDPPVSKRILNFLHERVAYLDDPRCIGDALKGSRLGEFWKYRVGDYRIICSIEDEALRILVVRIGNRREVYKRK